MDISQNLNLHLKQKLTLSKEMLMSLELIQLPLLELKEKIEKEILENPALELNEKHSDSDQDIEVLENSIGLDENNYFEDTSSASPPSGVSSNTTDSDLKRKYLEGAITSEKTLAEHLTWQLNVQNLTEKQKQIGLTIISLINEDGFLIDKLEDVFKDEDLKTANDVLEIIQMFDPPGIASKGVQEALIFQLESKQEEEINKIAYEIIKNHFDLLVNRKDGEIIKRLKITSQELKQAIEYISQFNPYPGRLFSSSQTKYIIPDAFVYKRENTLIVEMNEDILPSLTINKYVEKIVNQAKKKDKHLKEDEKFIFKKYNGAKQFINLVNYRNNSLFKLVLIIVKLQEDFFYKGPKFLKPLTMKEVAEEIGLSESTISRLSSSKYIQTEWGIHEIKYFFTNAVSKDNPNNQSAESIREIIKEIYESEKDKKISDQKIVEILQNRGIKIARRTVAKYRKILNILPSHHRK